MTNYPVLDNPPIMEAVLDIRVVLPPETTLVTLESFQDSIQARFPNKQPQRDFEFEFEVTESPSPQVRTPKSSPVGFLFRSENEQKVAQARLNGFTFSRLREYDKWSTFRDEARELWEQYKEIAKPKSVTRIALRYINRLDLPFPLYDLKRYILTTPEIAPDVPQHLLTYFMRLVIVDESSEALANVTQSMDPIPEDSKVVPLIFDIDVYKQKSYTPESLEVWSDFELLRNFKNQIFHNSVTKEAKELFR